MKIDGNPLFGGEVYNHLLGTWSISWESKGDYRHWCIQRHPKGKHPILVVMQNPGSLSGCGNNLTKDTTLRILRDIFQDTEAYPIIVNLFDFAASKQKGLYDNWEKRDGENLIYDVLDYSQFSGVIYAYGDCENNYLFAKDTLERIKYIKSKIQLPEINLIPNKNGTPKHPMTYQRQKLKPQISDAIKQFLS